MSCKGIRDADGVLARRDPESVASYYLAPSLVKLYREEINEQWPDRDRSSDGWIGDPSHSARESDHNPDWDDNGVVRAVDITRNGIDIDVLLDSVIGDHRVWYVIHRSVIWSVTYDFDPRPYAGSNPHEGHVHISIRHTLEAENDTQIWLPAPISAPPPVVSYSSVRAQALSSTPVPTAGVKVMQRTLSMRYGLTMILDGVYGPATRKAVRKHEQAIGRDPANGVIDRISLNALAENFRIKT